MLKQKKIIVLFTCLLCLCSCTSDDEKALKEKLASTSSLEQKIPKKLDNSIINEYREAELDINRRYVAEINTIISEDLDNKLEDFEDNELGFIESYVHMYKTLVDSKEDLADYWNIKKSKYFTPQSTLIKLHEAYTSYNTDVQRLRSQISKSPKCKSIPKEVRFNIPDQEVSLSKMSEHSYINLVIEFGLDIAIGILILLIILILSIFGIAAKKPSGWIILIIVLIVSVSLSLWNDNRMINSIREQYEETTEIDDNELLEQLDKSTNQFYDYLSKR